MLRRIRMLARKVVPAGALILAMVVAGPSLAQGAGGGGGGHGGGGHGGGGHGGGGHHHRFHHGGWSGGWYGPWWGWGYGSYFYGPFSGPRYLDRAYSAYGYIDTDVSPEDAEVYLDGEFVGLADDFDGPPGYLDVERGRHTLEFQYPGRGSLVVKVKVRPGRVIEIDRELDEQREEP